MAAFSGLPVSVPIPIIERIGENPEPVYLEDEYYEGKEKDLYLHLLKVGCKESEAAAIAKEIEEFCHE
jgi:hypothetical protein